MVSQQNRLFFYYLTSIREDPFFFCHYLNNILIILFNIIINLYLYIIYKFIILVINFIYFIVWLYIPISFYFRLSYFSNSSISHLTNDALDIPLSLNILSIFSASYSNIIVLKHLYFFLIIFISILFFINFFILSIYLF